MTAIATYVVVVVVPLIVVYLVFQALVRGVPEDRGYEIEVKLCPPSIRRRVSAGKSGPESHELQDGTPNHKAGETINATCAARTSTRVDVKRTL